DRAEKIMVETIRDVSGKRSVVGPDVMSILIPFPTENDPIIRVRYIPAGRGRGLLVAGDSRTEVPVSFSPWVISPGAIRVPSVLTNIKLDSVCGPYRVVIE